MAGSHETVLDKVILTLNIILLITIFITSIFSNKFTTRFPFRLCMFLWVSVYITTVAAFIATGDIPEKEKLFTVWSNIIEFANVLGFVFEFVILCTVILCVKYDDAYDRVDLNEDEGEPDEERIKFKM